uniref:Uncharacterized protein n=1 Tax=Tanacetum cinerariifolium TaxID=118510 RepID=A0A699HQ22_TANCI|nr:hypothetical protein [Tanacetum cinerariifolium]
MGPKTSRDKEEIYVGAWCQPSLTYSEAYSAYSPQGFNPPAVAAPAPALVSLHLLALTSVPAYGGPSIDRIISLIGGIR